MSQRMKIGGEWRALDIFMKVKGKWNKSIGVYIKVNGVWKLAQHIHAYRYVSNGEDTHTATCSLCGEMTTEEHTYVMDGDTKATCTESGSKIYLCEKCLQQKVEEVTALGHDYSLDVDYKSATCLEAGHHYATCSRCGDRWAEEIPATGHSTYDVPYSAATCCTPALVIQKCNYCDLEHITESGDLSLNPNNHEGPFTDIDPATVRCDACGVSFDSSIPH